MDSAVRAFRLRTDKSSISVCDGKDAAAVWRRHRGMVSDGGTEDLRECMAAQPVLDKALIATEACSGPRAEAKPAARLLLASAGEACADDASPSTPPPRAPESSAESDDPGVHGRTRPTRRIPAVGTSAASRNPDALVRLDELRADNAGFPNYEEARNEQRFNSGKLMDARRPARSNRFARSDPLERHRSLACSIEQSPPASSRNTEILRLTVGPPCELPRIGFRSSSAISPFFWAVQPLSPNSMPNDFATVKISLSPRPHMFMQIM